MAFARKLGWGGARLEALEELFGDLIIVDLTDEILEIYAEMDAFLERSGKPIQQNDVWIAATAAVTGSHLLTTDKDFDPLYPAYLDRTWIDPQQPDA